MQLYSRMEWWPVGSGATALLPSTSIVVKSRTMRYVLGEQILNNGAGMGELMEAEGTGSTDDWRSVCGCDE